MAFERSTEHIFPAAMHLARSVQRLIDAEDRYNLDQAAEHFALVRTRSNHVITAMAEMLYGLDNHGEHVLADSHAAIVASLKRQGVDQGV